MPSIIGYQLYVCDQGDTFDQIALEYYNDEKQMNVIINANPKYRDTIVFEGGEMLRVPVIEETSKAATLPPWRQ